jgi:hypothetical protein
MPSAADIIRDSITEFSRLQNWMLSVKDKDPATYHSMYDRYIELKVSMKGL